ncbi:tRNA-dihydrouridine synthase [Patescibacteria group bacterium]|nr:tRNA-dihydrouridine synthase [Patescibacteria group bacterium]
MKRGFWDKLERPILALAPMMDVTDSAFRQIVSQCSNPSVMWTEFVSTSGLCSIGEEFLVKRFLLFKKQERPLVAQLFGNEPKDFLRAAKIVCKLKFDGIDINMGCPEKRIVKQESGAALLRNPELARDIILATKEGAGDLPVSIKIRLGYTKIDWQSWLGVLLEAKPAVISVHGRTQKEMSKVPTHWDEIGKIVEFVKKQTKEAERPFIIGNGDVQTTAEAMEKAKQYNLDGIMIGRAVIGNPWFFDDTKTIDQIPLSEKLKTLLLHTKVFEKTFPSRNFSVIKKHYHAYITGFVGAKKLRADLMACDDSKSVKKVISQFIGR